MAASPTSDTSGTFLPVANDLRDSVRDYRNPATSDDDRDDIRAYWGEHGINNQFQAMRRAAELTEAATR
jgi:hypothetical protein